MPPPSQPPRGPDGEPPPPEPPWENPPPQRQGRRRWLGALVAAAYIAALVGTAVRSQDGFALLVGGLLLAVVLATVAMVSERMRPYAAGFLLGLGIVAVVGGGACIGLIAIVSASL